ncbi:aminotransferase class IV [Thermocrinis albus DSM 14484]|uniref:Aminotransferase class IV n=1 Tax=Thermocrinis albus (strain DSM 14484 / JCM 11386 / HI 11/12) TaxID=638303 RepID=D3SQ66_THEAH|nr:aminotransferase class IV [Thermocrinis albus]ADC89303.1 aminotransferase class IV [Thermocrinis albus DSM 14484]
MYNRTLLFGEGLFETLRLPTSERRLSLHYGRMKASADALGIPCPPWEEFVQGVRSAGYGPSVVRYTLVALGEGHYNGKAEAFRTEIHVRPIPSIPPSVKLCISSYRRHSSDPLCRHKTTSYFFNVLVKREANGRGFYDGVVLNERGHICETSSSCLIALKGSRVLVPSWDCGRLPSTTLQALSSFLDVEEEYIKPEDLESMDGVFIINAVVDCLPVDEVEGVKLRMDEDFAYTVRRYLRSF